MEQLTVEIAEPPLRQWWFGSSLMFGHGTVGGRRLLLEPSFPSTCSSNVPHQATSLTDVSAIGADSGHGFAVKSDGTAWSWGNKYRGSLGSGSTCETRIGTPVRVSGLTNARTITGFQAGGYVLDTDGRVWAWATTSGSPSARRQARSRLSRSA